MAEYSVDNTVSFVSAYVPEIREADEDNNNVPIIFDWANKETLDGDPYGDQTTQLMCFYCILLKTRVKMN